MFIEERSPDDPELTWLLHAAYAELVARYGARGRSGVHREARYLVAVADGEAAGCVALQPTPEDAATGEVKRMYVTPAARGRGVARALLRAVEGLAREVGYRRLRLATGHRQPAAIALYESAGYARTAPYGRYSAEAGQVLCFAKPLPPVRTASSLAPLDPVVAARSS
ncbi:GNAT family N-acetyltransferase [Streptomyces sp. 6N223]|uniref:GNAT family N-acetyltransferase n=1 Tax=Streptomyces sp. 6N223 TaxID=3457412 RepID=UPI003FD12164